MSQQPQYYPSIIIKLSDLQNHQEMIVDFAQSSYQNLPPTAFSWYNTTEENLTIKTVRALLADLTYSTPTGYPRISTLIAADTASLPAQNALLKILEEPPTNTQIILATTQPEKLLPTIQSRCLVTDLSQQTDRDQPKSETQLQAEQEANSFLDNISKLSYAPAIALAEKFKSKQEAEIFLQALLKIAHAQHVELHRGGGEVQHHFKGKGETDATQKHTLIALMKNVNLALKQLSANVNVRLVVEHCFFMIKMDQKI
jgi:hypothetical protein